ncbi:MULTISPECIES: preprotein translocase subunit YajC [unclassified Capnocytophaga]|jgi:preprotein translocase, yajC subunit|uniref:preprotein translocase subunit YajC n=1 Tax=unclassified Capnocytophaga TaxID=2640652 RepID=UPI000202E945|nr:MULTISPECIES: preprotein translocase subunit YajC [unclassified Capnocytophaga]EGD33092.1 preprotein translocase [Capnocytophaga sp. oral taxon 338 str. F0234]MEB3005536.1 preprotein translocase subunit YajC [Capnocytophaga sp. G2]
MNIVLQAAPQGGGGNFLFILIMVVIMFAFMIFPSMRRQRQEKKFYESLKKGDKVIMKSGLHGRIVELTDTSVVIETLSGKLKFERTAVSLDYSRRIQQTEDK